MKVLGAAQTFVQKSIKTSRNSFQNATFMLSLSLFTGLTSGWVILAVLPIIAALVILRQFAMTLSRSLQHVETRGELEHKSHLDSHPDGRNYLTFLQVFLFACFQNGVQYTAHLAKTLQGMSMIRAYRMENDMIQEFDRLQNFHTAPSFALRCGIDGWQAVTVNVILSVFLTT